MNGAIDIDLGWSPSTNTLPIKRLNLEIGQSSGELIAAWVRFPELTLQPLPQEHIRLAERQYRYSSRGSAFRYSPALLKSRDKRSVSFAPVQVNGKMVEVLCRKPCFASPDDQRQRGTKGHKEISSNFGDYRFPASSSVFQSLP